MKKIIFIFFTFLSFTISINAQVFWTEAFQAAPGLAGCEAPAYLGVNGAWTISTTGLNGADPNVWYVSGEECGNAATVCGSVCTGIDPSLHIGSNITVLGDLGASFLNGGFGIWFPETHVRSESPIINCTGKTNITLAFNYLEDGDGLNDDATLWYFDGLVWSQISPLAKTPLVCMPQGQWTAFSILLPASANNNPNVKIGFNWVNNDDGVGDDPTIAVDDITLSVPTVTTSLSVSLTLPSPVCQSNTITASFTSTSSPTSFSWTATSGSVVFSAPNSGTTSISFTTPGTYTVSLTACIGTVCATATSSVLVIATPTINVTASPTVICLPGSSTLTATGGPSPTSYTWAASSGPAITNTNVTIVSPLVNTTYTVLTSVPGCTTGIIFNVPVSTPPTLTLTPNSAICLGQSLSLTASGAASYTWAPAGTLSSTTGAIVTATPVVTTQYTVTGFNGVCSNTAVVTVTVGASSTVSVTPTATTICAGQSASLLAFAGSTYTWIASSGATPSGVAGVTVTPAVTTTYTVLTGSGTCTAQAIATVSVAPAFTLTATPSTTTICSGGSGVSITATGATSYSWSPALGLSSTTGAIVTANPTITTVYTIIGSNGICSTTTLVTVNVTSVSTTLTASATNYCLGGTPVTLTATGATSYSWSPALGLSSTVGSVVTATPAVTTVYTVIGTTGACTSTKTITITVPVTSSLTIISSSTLICSGGSGATLTGSGASTYTWLPSSVATATLLANPLSTTVYTLTGNTLAGCIAVPAIITVSVAPALSPTISASSASVCLTKTVSISATPIGAGYSYTWSPSFAILGGVNSSSIIAKPTSSTTVIYTLTISNGICTSSGTVALGVIVCIAPSSSFNTLSNDSICTKGCVTFNATSLGTPPLTYQWFFDGGTPPFSTLANPEICYFAAGNYSVVLVTTNPYGTDTIIKLNYINVADTPMVVHAFGDTLIKVGQTAPISANGASTYLWLPNNGSVACPTCSNTIAQPTITTQYIVVGSNSPYCRRQDTILVRVDFTCGDFFVPNVFSPNADGLNDVINVNGFCIYTYNLQIFSRWGEMVFETKDRSISWDGTFKGKPMDTGVFVYRADGITIDGKPFTIKGNITLLR
jgi:gliding motility-associated-like protein